jgi:hypothetical protein
MTRSDVGKDQVQPDDVSGLADDFAAMKSQSSPEQSTFKSAPNRESATPQKPSSSMWLIR